ncbi:MAG: RnfABCDGE type electron transport complex subunit G [Gemmatimonadetes bacterium]|nr:RnfABCDGE type electron transport complex subunit G [Gemmatimonadota bacterium]
MTDPAGTGQPAAADVRTSRLVTTLGGLGALAGLLIVVVFRWTQPSIQAHKAEVLRQAINEVLKEPDSYDTLYLVDGKLETEPAAGLDRTKLEQVYLGHRGNGGSVGFAVAAAEPGFQDVIRLIFGYDPKTGHLMAMKVLESKETPGLGDKILKDSAFIGEFEGAAVPLNGVKRGSGKAGDASQVDMITGATISSRTVIRAINQTIARLGPIMDAYARNATQ